MENLYVCLSDLLDQDLTSYEYYHALPKEIQEGLKKCDISSFSELQAAAAQIRESGILEITEGMALHD